MSVVNTKQLDDMAKQIEQIPDCRALEELIVKLEKVIKDQLEAMLKQIADLAELALPPTSLKKLIKWCKKHAAYYYEQYIKAVETYTALVKAFARIMSAIQDKLAHLDCRNIKMPSVKDILPQIPDTGIFLQLKEIYKFADDLKKAQGLLSDPLAMLSKAGDLLDKNLADQKVLDAQEAANAAAAATQAAANAAATAAADAATKRAAVRLDSSEPRNPEPTGG